MVAAQAAADAATAHFAAQKQHNGSTIRDIPFPAGTPPRLRAALMLWYAFSQLLASCMFLAYRLDTAFAVLAVVQLSSFAMTLCRKGVLSCAGWHAFYSAALAAVFALHVFAAPVTHPAQPGVARVPELALMVPLMAALAVARFRLRVSKYRLWTAVILLHAAVVRFGGTLEFVSV